VYHYAELLFRWQIYHKRLELLKAVTRRDGTLVPIRTEVNRIGMFDLVTCFGRQEVEWIVSLGLHRICPRADCKMLLPERVHICPYCNAPCSMPACTVCRLPVKGLYMPIVFVSQLQLTFECFICRSFEDVSQLLTCNAHLVLEFVGIVNAGLSFGVWVLLHWHCRVVDEAFDEVGVDAASDDVVVCFRTSLRVVLLNLLFI
jgi:hypothetical protein